MSARIDGLISSGGIQRRAERDAEVRHMEGDPLLFGVRVAILRVTEVHENYLVCKLVIAGGVSAGTVNVAKYPEVQRAEYEGATTTDPVDGGDATYSYTDVQERTVTLSGGGGTEDQRIVPWYIPAGGSFAGSRLVAVSYRTSVTGDALTGSVVCPWLEVTNRAWAKV
jgi:hypothetical protein